PLGSLAALGKRNANDNRSQIQTIFVFPGALLPSRGWAGPGGGGTSWPDWEWGQWAGAAEGSRRCAGELGLAGGRVRTGPAAHPVITAGRSAGGRAQQPPAAHPREHPRGVAAPRPGSAATTPPPAPGCISANAPAAAH